MAELPVATRDNWRDIGHRIHNWFMADMGIPRHSIEEMVFLGLALGGEAGELQNWIKKWWRDKGKLTYEDVLNLKQAILKEMADVQGYLEHMADCMEVDLDNITAQKTNELIRRWPHIFEEQGADG